MKAKFVEDRDAINGLLIRDVQKTLRDADSNLSGFPKFPKEHHSTRRMETPEVAEPATGRRLH